jgi:ankyrin repeat protein
MTPIHVAALFGYMDSVNLLVENKANLGTKNS